MQKRVLTLLTLLALAVQLFVPLAYADSSNTYSAFEFEMEAVATDDDTPLEGTLDSPQVHEEETITFDSFTPRQLEDVEILRKGVDVSSHQGEIDWAQVKEAGVEFAFIRVGYHGLLVDSLNEDSYYKKNLEGALEQGLRVGVYFYSQAITVEEAIAEADYVLQRIDGYALSLPVVFDYEYGSYNGTPGRLLAANLTQEEATQICQAFINRVEASGYDSLVYANRNFLYNQLNRDKLGAVWLAHYALSTDYVGGYSFWQCTSSGRVNGIRGYADLDFWFDDGSYKTVLPFRDVSVRSWSYSSIRYAYENGLVKGVSDNTFAPKEDATRGDVATMLYRLMGTPEVESASPFTDLTHRYHEDPVAWAYAQGIITGRTETTFDPNASVTRQELVSMLYRLAGSPASQTALTDYEDWASVNNYAKSAMAWAVEVGIIQGSYDDGKTLLRPRDSASREEIATILMRFSKLGLASGVRSAEQIS